MEEIKVKVWCEKIMPTYCLKDNKIKELVGGALIEFYDCKIVSIKIDDIISELGHEGYFYTNELYDIIHERYKKIDFVTHDGDWLEYEIYEGKMKKEIPYLAEPLKSKEQFIELLKKEEK